MENDFRNRRRHYYIDKDFQKKFILKFCSLVILGTVISGLLIFLMSRGTVTTVFEESRLKIKSTADFILPALLGSSLVVVVLVGLATIIVTLYASHKIAGPLYRVGADLKKVFGGDLTVKFGLRRHDQLKALAENMDETIGMVHDEILDLKNRVRGLEAALEEAQRSNDLSKLKEARSRLQDIANKLSRFKT